MRFLHFLCKISSRRFRLVKKLVAVSSRDSNPCRIAPSDEGESDRPPKPVVAHPLDELPGSGATVSCPCRTRAMTPDWVIFVAHDNLPPSNYCSETNCHEQLIHSDFLFSTDQRFSSRV